MTESLSSAGSFQSVGAFLLKETKNERENKNGDGDTRQALGI